MRFILDIAAFLSLVLSAQAQEPNPFSATRSPIPNPNRTATPYPTPTPIPFPYACVSCANACVEGALKSPTFSYDECLIRDGCPGGSTACFPDDGVARLLAGATCSNCFKSCKEEAVRDPYLVYTQCVLVYGCQLCLMRTPKDLLWGFFSFSPPTGVVGIACAYTGMHVLYISESGGLETRRRASLRNISASGFSYIYLEHLLWGVLLFFTYRIDITYINLARSKHRYIPIQL